MKSKLVIVALIAFAAGGTCPSDVNNDGTVGINDFLQLLGDWGPCPQAKVVGFGLNVANAGQVPFVVRVWSDGLTEFKVTSAVPDWEPQVWTPVPANPNAPQSQLAAAHGDGHIIHRVWTDGTIDKFPFAENPGIVYASMATNWITEPN